MKKDETYKIDDAYRNLENINSWINNSDTKASIILGLVGILLTINFSNNGFVENVLEIVGKCIKEISFSDILYLCFVIASIVFFCYGLYNLLKVLVPTLKTNIKLKKNSIIYFGSISNYSSCQEFKSQVYDIKGKDLLDDLLNQIYINSNICNIKFKNFCNGIKYSIIGYVLFIILFLIGLLIYV